MKASFSRKLALNFKVGFLIRDVKNFKISIFSKTKRNIKNFYSFLSTYLLVISRKERVTFFDIALQFRENRL